LLTLTDAWTGVGSTAWALTVSARPNSAAADAKVATLRTICGERPRIRSAAENKPLIFFRNIDRSMPPPFCHFWLS
jgi:hypothetical protein